MSEIVNQSLQKIAKGTGIIFIGSLLGLFLAFISRLIIARYWTESDYGVFSLALVMLNICVIISTLGLQNGVSRSIAYARGKNEREKIQGLISSSLCLALAGSLILCLILFFTSEAIAIKIFHEPALTVPLKIFAIAIPFFTIINVLVSIFLGFGRVQAKVYFQDILRNVLFLILLLAVILFNLSFIEVFYAYMISLAILCLILVIYAIKHLHSPIRITFKPPANPVAKELLFFSFPLLGVAMLQMIITWTDTLMLGSFKSSAEVGMYNVALPLAQLIGIPMAALLPIYGPITAGLYAQNSVPELRRNYTILTKWIFSATLPLFLLLFLFPEIVLDFLFGANYMLASQALRILSLGFIIVNLLGPNGTTLMAVGETKFLMWAIVVAACMNIALNTILIPQWGIIGAATATTASLTLHCIIRHVKVHSILGVTPLTKNLLKPMISSISIVFIIYLLVGHFLSVTFWMLPLLFILFYAIYFMALLLTRSFDQEDITMIVEIEKRMGLNLLKIKKVVKNFIK